MSDQPEEVKMSCSIWQSQSADTTNVSLESVRRQSEKRRRSMSNERNVSYIIATVACGTSAMSGFKFLTTADSPVNVVFGLSALLFSLALMAAVVYTQKYLRVKKFEIESAVNGGLAVYRSELERLIKLACKEWYVLLFFVPSYLMVLIGGLMFDERPGKAWRYGLTVVAGVASIGFAFWVGRKKSRCLQRELNVIDSLQ